MDSNKRKIKYWVIGLIILAILVLGIIAEISKKEEEGVAEPESPKTNLKDLKQSAPDEASSLFQEEGVREPAAAGSFYPNIQADLERAVQNFLENTKDSPVLSGEIVGMLVPHAAWEFSGQAQAYAYKNLQGKKIRTVILIGPSHYESFDGISIYPEGYFRTPLGKVKIDGLLARAIMSENEKISSRESAHTKEHSLEVQLPFLQKVLPQARIVPIILGSPSRENVNILAQAILKHIPPDTIVIASSDLSHYPPKEVAEEVDRKVIEAILSRDPNNLSKTLEELAAGNYLGVNTFLCGEAAVETIMLVAQGLGADQATLLKYYNSGDTEKGDKEKVVGYGAIAFTLPQRYGAYSEEERKTLLNLARETVESYIKTGEVQTKEIASSRLEEPKGAFVTIKKEGELRGCIGHFPQDQALTKTIQETALSAAIHDQRFTPVTSEELGELKYEISVLSALQKIEDPDDIVLGRHGVMIKKGEQGGVFLPQVAEETGWGFAEFMSELCSQKGGLLPDCWQEPETEIYIFTAEVFGEK